MQPCPPTTAPTPRPTAPTPVTPKPSTPTTTAPTLDYDELADKLVEKMANDGRFRGPKGDQGDTGPAGPSGEPGPPGKDATVDMEALTAAVLAKLPPTRVQFLDGNGSVSQEFTYKAGEPILLPPNFVKQLDSQGKVFDEEAFPLNTPIILRYGAKTEAR